MRMINRVVWLTLFSFVIVSCSNDSGDSNQILDNISDREEALRKTVSTDSNNDGTVNYIETHTYNTDGNTLNYSRDEDADGIFEGGRSFTYDANGNLLSRIPNRNSAGIAEAIFTYDSYGNLLTAIYDKNADGNPDWNISYTYEGDKRIKYSTAL